MSPQEAERQRLENYIEQVEKYQEGRYGKSFRNATDGKYEVEQVVMKEAESSVDTAEACSITYINIDRDPRELDVREMGNKITNLIRATMGKGGQAKGSLSFDKDGAR